MVPVVRIELPLACPKRILRAKKTSSVSYPEIIFMGFNILLLSDITMTRICRPLKQL